MTKLIYLTVLLILPLLLVSQSVDAQSIKPKFVDVKDVFMPTKRPTNVNFDIVAVDGDGRKLAVQCDKISGQIFPVGITRVNCNAEDVYKNIIRTHFLVIVGYEVVDIPSWFKQPTKFWLEKGITDAEYYESIKYLLNKKSIIIPSIGSDVDKPSETVPSWIVASSKLWTEDRLGDHEFSIVIKWFIENRFVDYSNQSQS